MMTFRRKTIKKIKRKKESKHQHAKCKRSSGKERRKTIHQKKERRKNKKPHVVEGGVWMKCRLTFFLYMLTK